MELEMLKKGFFGYKKESVYQYIASVEDEFSTKLLEKDEQIKKNEEMYLERIHKLEEELENTKQRLETQQNDKTIIASAILDAKRFAEKLKIETEEEENKARKHLEDELDKKNEELKKYQEQIAGVRKMLRSILNTADEQLKNTEKKIDNIKESAPERNMSLFERKTYIEE